MKKIAALLLILFCVFSLVGCSKNITLNNEQNELVAEYIAGELLKYTYDNKWNYQKLQNGVNVPTTMPTQPATSEQQPTDDDITQATPENSSEDILPTSAMTDGNVMENMANALGLGGMTISYSSYTTGSVYPQDEFALGVKANEGYKLYVFEFTIANNTNDTITANTYSKGVTLKLDIGGSSISQSATILKNDLIILKDKAIEAGKTYDTVVVFQVPDNLEAASGLSLSVYSNGTLLGKVPGL